MPDRDMDETINTDMPFEEAVTALLNAGRVEDDRDTPEDAQ